LADGGATAKAIDYSLNNWKALTRNLHDGDVPVSNNHLENLMRPWAVGRKAWLFCGSELAGQRAAMVMSLVQSAKLCGHDPHAYLRDVLQRLPEHPARRLDELLPHRWQPRPDRARSPQPAGAVKVECPSAYQGLAHAHKYRTSSVISNVPHQSPPPGGRCSVVSSLGKRTDS
jgi:hypothetical protein